MKIRRRIIAALIALGTVAGIGIVGTAPAQAASSTQYCNWPNRARRLGSTSGSHGFWYTGWEDVRFVINGASSYSTACYY
jgi:uncharacterized membrane protein YesL